MEKKAVEINLQEIKNKPLVQTAFIDCYAQGMDCPIVELRIIMDHSYDTILLALEAFTNIIGKEAMDGAGEVNVQCHRIDIIFGCDRKRENRVVIN